MVKIIEGNFTVKGKKIAIVASRFNDFVTKELVAGCQDTLSRHGVADNDITLVWVPGSFEIPCIAKKIADSRNYDAIICLGTIIRGSTPHFEYIASEVSKGISSISLNSGIPVVFGIITADTIEQAIERAGTKAGNKGRDAALGAIEMANLIERIA